MPIKSTRQITKARLILLNWILVLVSVTALVKIVESRKLDETTVPSTNGGEKCAPCGDYSPPPPPPIVYPSPPPPIVYPSPPPPPPIVYPSPPPPEPIMYPSPPPPKKPPSEYCPPPPPSSNIYITGPPGNLYPVDENFTASEASSPNRLTGFNAFFFPLLAGLVTLLAFWY